MNGANFGSQSQEDFRWAVGHIEDHVTEETVLVRGKRVGAGSTEELAPGEKCA